MRLSRFRSTLRQLVNGSAFLFGIIGVIVQVLIVAGMLSSDPWIRVFWLSLLVDCFVYMRLSRDGERRVIIPKATTRGALFDVAVTLTEEARQSLLHARAIAERRGEHAVNALHLFAACSMANSVEPALRCLGIERHRVIQKTKHFLDGTPRDTSAIASDELYEILFDAYAVAEGGAQASLTPHAILLALFRREGTVRDILLSVSSAPEADIDAALRSLWNAEKER